MHILTAAGASAKSLRSIQSDNMHFAKEHNKCLGSKIIYQLKLLGVSKTEMKRLLSDYSDSVERLLLLNS